MGAFLTPMLVGPVLGKLTLTHTPMHLYKFTVTLSLAPLFGGLVAERFGWRSTFALNSALTFIIGIVSLLYIPETHHYFVLKRYSDSIAQEDSEEVTTERQTNRASISIDENISVGAEISTDNRDPHVPRKIYQVDHAIDHEINHTSNTLKNSTSVLIENILSFTSYYSHIDRGKNNDIEATDPSALPIRSLTPMIIEQINTEHHVSIFDAVALLFEVH